MSPFDSENWFVNLILQADRMKGQNDLPEMADRIAVAKDRSYCHQERLKSYLKSLGHAFTLEFSGKLSHTFNRMLCFK